MEKVKYIVHSDMNENNIYKEFDNSVDAIKYAKDNIIDETWVDMVTFPEGAEDDYENAEVFTIWNYADENYLDQEFPESDIANVKDVDDADYAEFDKMYKEDISLEEAVDKLEENEDEVECKGCYELTPKKECIKTEAGYFCPHCAKELKEAKEDENPFALDFDGIEDEEIESEVEEPKEEVKDEEVEEKVDKEKPEEVKEESKSYEELIDFLIADEDEAIKGYDGVLAQLEDEHVIEELNKVRTEEVAHKEFLEKVKEDKGAIYVEPLEPEEEVEEEEVVEDSPKDECKKPENEGEKLTESVKYNPDILVDDILSYFDEHESLKPELINYLKGKNYSEEAIKDLFVVEPEESIKENLTEGDIADDIKTDDLDVAADKQEEIEKALVEIEKKEAPKDECLEEELLSKDYYDAMYKAYKELKKRKTAYGAVYGFSKKGKFTPLLTVKNDDKSLEEVIDAIKTKPKGQIDATVYVMYTDKLDDIEDTLKEQGYIKEVKEEVNKNIEVKIGDVIHINHLQGEDTSKDGKEGIVKSIDDMGQLHGTWGGVAVIPGVDDFEVIKPEITEAIIQDDEDKLTTDIVDTDIASTIASWN